ncbi:MAG: Sua5/YciO/YrdC/YwlC family protein, partial [Anaerolineae bacterium]|nr:Sua5/YciO/YrdC/YwlC family protein [Anaerolineae bacterium]
PRSGRRCAARRRKGRGDKPFAVMLPDLATAQRIADLSEAEIEALSSRARPIVITQQRPNNGLSHHITPGNPSIGLMLPYSPLHYVLLHHLQALGCTALVMTSGNLSDEPIVIANAAALQALAPLADAFLLHNRDIYINCDDSVVRSWALGGTTQLLPIRRSRGYAPMPVTLPFEIGPTLAVGGELKATLCLASGASGHAHAFISQHIGDMENAETLAAFERTAAHLSQIFRIAPQVVVCDKHPGYLSSQWAHAYAQTRGLRCVTVQHHHAHIAAVMAEHGLPPDARVIGIAFDGTGYGDDGAIWGGEVLVGGYAHYRRAAHLAYAPLPGGDAAIKRPYRAALAQLWANGLAWDEALPCVQACPPAERRILQQQLARNLATPTSSMGRLFDAVAAVLGVRQVVGYEAQGAIELEHVAADGVTAAYRFGLNGGGGEPNPTLISPQPLWIELLADLRTGVPVPVMAAKFHNAVADLVLHLGLVERAHSGLNVVALSGGCFQNVRLLAATVTRLQAHGFEVLFHRLVPPNDGGLALGQVAVAAHS